MGAVLIILAGSSQSPFVSRLLSWQPMVFVGLISYSLYLWHWPVYTLSDYLRGGYSGPVEAASNHHTIISAATIRALPVIRVRMEVIEVSCGRYT